MPKYTPSDEDMDSSYGSSDQGEVKPPDESGAESVDEKNETAETTVVPNKILSPDGEPLKEGDEIVVQIVKNYGDESEIKYAPHKAGEEEGEASDTGAGMAGVGSELTALDQEKA